MEGYRLTVAGKRNDPDFEQCRRALEALGALDRRIEAVVCPCFEIEWDEYLKGIQKTVGGIFLKHKNSPIVYINRDEYIGGVDAFLVWAEKRYEYHDSTNRAFYNRRCQENLKRHMLHNPARAYCYLDLKMGRDIPTSVVFELFLDVAPLTCRNFLELCKGFDDGEGQLVSYKGTSIDRVVPHGFVQGGNIIGRKQGRH